MKLYNARVRLGGAITNEVNKEKLTAAEIAVLQRVHGRDAVQAIVEVGSVANRSDQRERARLSSLYQKGPGADGSRLEGEAFIASIFGVAGVPLPKEYVAEPIVDEDEALAGEVIDIEEVIELAEKPTPIKRTRVPRPAPVDAAEMMA
jgi:hypothetical protein